MNIGSILAVDQSDSQSWFIWDLDEERLLEALEPDPSEIPRELTAELELLLAALPPADRRLPWTTVQVLNVP